MPRRSKRVPAHDKKIRLVKQKDEFGCVVACLAMVLGKTYEEVDADFDNDFTKKGTQLAMIADYLSDHGYSIIKKSVSFYSHKDFGREELLTPFAPSHIVIVKDKVDLPFDHAIVMDNAGKLYCPSGSPDEESRNAYLIISVIGIYKN
jgi:hypothetical protein